MSSKDYIIGNTGIILCDAPYIYVAASLSDLSKVEDSSSNMGVWYYVIIGISIVIVIVVIFLVYYFAKKELKKTLGIIQKEKEEAIKKRSETERGHRERNVTPREDNASSNKSPNSHVELSDSHAAEV